MTAASRSAALVAACRALADERPKADRLISDPFARLFVDDDALEAARADEPLQRVIQLRTRSIDDVVEQFAVANNGAQVLLLGAGLDARAFRMAIPASFFEIDVPATLAHKAEVATGARPRSPRTVVPVDLAASPFVAPLLEAGFDRRRPSVVVWEGVVFYLDQGAVISVVDQLADLLEPGSLVVADYVAASWRDDGLVTTTRPIARRLRDGGEPLQAAPVDLRSVLHAAGFDVVDDEAVELLASRYRLPVPERVYPARLLTARRR